MSETTTESTTAEATTTADQTQTTEAPAQAKQETLLGGNSGSTQQTKETPAIPEKYELKLPENSILKAEQLEKIASFAKERGFSQEHAQALVEREHSVLSEFVQAQTQKMEQIPQQWYEASKADKEFGGNEEAFQRNAELAKRVVHKFGGEEFMKELDRTGFGNHPELLRVFYRIGKSMAEDQLVMPNAQTGGDKSVTELFYGKTE
jgi:hypothetical protein